MYEALLASVSRRWVVSVMSSVVKTRLAWKQGCVSLCVIDADICNTCKYLGSIDRSVFCVPKTGVIAAMDKEVLVFDVSVGIREHALLWLEDGDGCICQLLDVALQGGLIGGALEEHDDRQCSGHSGWG